MNNKNLIVTLAMLSSAFAIAGPPSDGDNVVREVTCVEISFADAVANKDSTQFKSLVHKDARFVGAGVARGVEAVLDAWAPFLTEGGPEIIWRPMIVEVLQSGDLALSRGPYRLQVRGEDGSLSEEWGTYNSIWQKQPAGNWQIVFDAGSEDAGAPSGKARELIETPQQKCVD